MTKYLFALVLFFSLTARAQTFSGTGGPIPDAAPGAYFTIPVSGLSATTLDHTFGLVQVCVHINHSYDGDLEAKYQQAMKDADL